MSTWRQAIIWTNDVQFTDAPQQQTSLVPCWSNVDPVSSMLGQRGPNVPCYLGIYASLDLNEFKMLTVDTH